MPLYAADSELSNLDSGKLIIMQPRKYSLWSYDKPVSWVDVSSGYPVSFQLVCDQSGAKPAAINGRELVEHCTVRPVAHSVFPLRSDGS